MCMFVYIYTYIYIYTCIYTHIHTYIHIYRRPALGPELTLSVMATWICSPG